ncbi:MAG TPA: ATPase, T2SS/T4P/T4SS family [Mobilitalea sp.]|nr:ATPase, T2SS/T4P/T4SS family [Mobilitalea sp.]
MEFIHTNIVIIAFITALVLLFIYFLFKKEIEPEEENIEENKFSLLYLEEGIKRKVNEIVDQNIYELLLSKKETKKREYQKARLSKAVRTCAQGNIGERDYMKDYSKDLLQDCFNVNEETINRIIPFNQPLHLTAQDKFEILYTIYNKENKYRAFDELNRLCNFDREKVNEFGIYYEITTEDINIAYDRLNMPLSYVDRLEVVAQRIYQEIYGISVADILRYDLTIDGISGGCSGASTEQYNYMEEIYASGGTSRSKTYNSVWIFFHGKAIHLSFLSFSSQNDLIRTCKNLYRYGTVGHLNSKSGYKLTYQADGSRVVVVRPNFATHWAFFLRKFDSTKNMTIHKLLINDGSDMVVEMMMWIIKGCLNVVLSGDQNSGKTTCLKALGIFFDLRNPVRTTEQEFELWLNNAYINLNCLCLRGTEGMSVIDAINIQKKMDAAIMLLGEVNSYELAAAYISLCLSGTKSAICTCHCVSSEDLVDYFRNSIMASGMFRTEMTAEEQVANSVHIDIHWEKAANGCRYISYINEIIPYPREIKETDEIQALDSIANSLRLLSRKRAFYIRPLVVLENNQYVIKNNFSERASMRILKNLAENEKAIFQHFCSAK